MQIEVDGELLNSEVDDANYSAVWDFIGFRYHTVTGKVEQKQTKKNKTFSNGIIVRLNTRTFLLRE